MPSKGICCSSPGACGRFLSRAEIGAGHCLGWVGSDCPWVLERGFEGRLSSTYGGICPLCSNEEAEMDLLSHWHRVTYG